jgi:hypothetical protein
MDNVGVYNCWGICIFHRLLGYLDAVVYDEQGVVGPKDLVVERNAIQVLLQ